ncbi:hypothetical protein [Achromobacter xylosoxidans]|uniref:hypothetical protein n=2 Tax=Alcaligenes xylosoxydans xylosoxydans TaxID=85698 RepID=UPI001EEF4372|nr:hypothetical protein [Achromobacter xylosoxidans]
MATRIYKTPFAATGDKEALATADQPDGKVSLQAGWTPDYELANDNPNYRPVGRAEMNGILNEITGALGELQMSGFAPWQAVSGGWPKDAYVVHEGVAYRSLIDSNEDAPGTSEASWVPAFNYGIGVVSGMTNANVTLNAGQYSKPIVTLSGALTGNVQIIFPKTLQRWLVVNNTTGAFTVTCKTAAGTGVAIPSGGSQEVWGDGVNLYAYVPAQVQALLPFRGQQAFTTPGTTNWTVPAGVYAIYVEAWGGRGRIRQQAGDGQLFCWRRRRQRRISLRPSPGVSRSGSRHPGRCSRCCWGNIPSIRRKRRAVGHCRNHHSNGRQWWWRWYDDSLRHRWSWRVWRIWWDCLYQWAARRQWGLAGCVKWSGSWSGRRRFAERGIWVSSFFWWRCRRLGPRWWWR